MFSSLFGRKDKQPEAASRKPSEAPRVATPRPSAVPSGQASGVGARGAVVTRQRPTSPTQSNEAHAQQMMQRINAIESEMAGDDVALASRPGPNKSKLGALGPAAFKKPAKAGSGLDVPKAPLEMQALEFMPSKVDTNLPNMGEAGASTLLGDSINALAVEIEGSKISPEIEEAAILYANSQADAAIALLQQYASDGASANTQQAWALLFDLYQVLGKQQEFDSLSMDYAARFESSPPAWNPEDAPNVVAPKVSANPSMVVFPETLDVNASKQLEAIQRAAQRGRAVTLDFGQLKYVDAEGALVLLKIFAGFKKSTLELIVYHAKRLLAAAEAGIEVGRRDECDSIWKIRLETLRLLGMQQAFDDAAIDMCVTYEISPPSWEPMGSQIRAEESNGASSEEVSPVQTSGARDDRFMLVGDALGAFERELRDLNVFADPFRDVLVDCRRLRRVDFVAAGNLMNTLVALRQKGKAITLHEPNNLVVALFSAMGLAEVATIRPRKF